MGVCVCVCELGTDKQTDSQTDRLTDRRRRVKQREIEIEGEEKDRRKEVPGTDLVSYVPVFSQLAQDQTGSRKIYLMKK